MNTLYMTLGIFTHTFSFLLMGYGVYCWDKFDQRQNKAKDALKSAISTNDHDHELMAHWHTTRCRREYIGDPAHVTELLNNLEDPTTEYEEKFAAEGIGLHDICSMTSLEFKELGVAVGLRTKLKEKAQERYDELLRALKEQDSQQLEDSNSFILLEQRKRLHFGSTSHEIAPRLEPLTDAEKTATWEAWAEKSGNDTAAYQEKMQRNFKLFLKIFVGVYIFILVSSVVVMEALPCAYEPSHDNWFGV